ncbi:MAG: hypothetical protein CVU71_02170 [Deltaproteobacteria bacterium HGW-Deltaproteobacteria-6]|nr:MAG: hypothetical protein CVU71_02170 [Deltaproteobacteria bacterium HGW-Deltaproteobacteria-6]PKN96688.1 MAG: hypothetical protein CVU43_19405 [Chloroflexi bacterium HGW-Chloroflexi-5]
MSTVCAIILDYYGSIKTIACLTSLINQGLDSVMIVDNSGNHQANIQLQEALHNFNQREIPFTIYQIVNPMNLGYSAGVNNALRWLEKNQPHQYYLLINNDAEATAGMLPQLLKFMNKQDRTALAAPVIDTGVKQITCHWYQRLSGLLFSHHIIGTFPFLSGCCLLVDRQIIKDGLFDEDFFMYGEDIALCWRLKQIGWKTAFVRQAIVRHEGTGSSRQGGYFYEYHLARMHILLASKLATHRWETPFLYFGRLLTLSARAVVRAIRYQSLVPITASLHAMQKHNVSTA